MKDKQEWIQAGLHVHDEDLFLCTGGRYPQPVPHLMKLLYELRQGKYPMEIHMSYGNKGSGKVDYEVAKLLWEKLDERY